MRMCQKLMNIFKQFLKSLYSPKDIAKFRFQGIGKTILFVFLLTLLSILPTTFKFASVINNGLELTKDALKEDVPPFIIKDGKLTSESKTPYIFEDKGIKIIIDGTGSVDQSNIDQSETVLALLENEFVFMAGGQAQVSNYSMFPEMNLTNQDIVEFLQSLEGLKYIFLPIMILIIYIFSSGIKFIEVSILALFGLLVKNLLKKNVTYRHTWRIAAYSVTLPTVFFTVMALLQTQVPNGFIINWFVSIMVLTLAIKEIPVKRLK
jgi:hypothetical protein